VVNTHIQRNCLHETVIKHPDRAEVTRVWNFPYATVEETVDDTVIIGFTRNANPLRYGSTEKKSRSSVSPARIGRSAWKTRKRAGLQATVPQPVHRRVSEGT
jgi:hypothetical protein